MASGCDGQARHVAPLARPASFAFKLSLLVLVLSWATWVAYRGDTGTGGDATRGTFSTLEYISVIYVRHCVHHLSGGVEVRAGKTAKGQAAAAVEVILANGCRCPDFVAPGVIKLGSVNKRCRIEKERKDRDRSKEEKQKSEREESKGFEKER